MRKYITGNFEKDLKKTIDFLKDRTVSEDARLDLAQDFCEVYVYFDSCKFDKYFE